MSNKKVCLTAEHDNFLTVISKEVAPQYQTAANLLRCLLRSDSIPTSCNNQHLLRLSYLVRMIKASWPDNKVDQVTSSYFPAARKKFTKDPGI